MNRQYRVGDYLDMIEAANEALSDDTGLPPAITTDIICGFPGESEADFLETVQVAASRLHAYACLPSVPAKEPRRRMDRPASSPTP